MDAHVDDETAAVGRIGILERRTGRVAADAFERHWAADLTFAYRFECVAVARVEAAHEAHLQQDAGAFECVQYGMRVGKRQCQRFFAEDGSELARSRSGDEHLGVGTGRRRDDYGVDVGQGQDGLGLGEDSNQAQLGLDGGARPRIGIGDRVQLDARAEAGQGLRVKTTHPTEADDSNSDHGLTSTDAMVAPRSRTWPGNSSVTADRRCAAPLRVTRN